jgi:hypothetical protein
LLFIHPTFLNFSEKRGSFSGELLFLISMSFLILFFEQGRIKKDKRRINISMINLNDFKKFSSMPLFDLIIHDDIYCFSDVTFVSLSASNAKHFNLKCYYSSLK